MWGMQSGFGINKTLIMGCKQAKEIWHRMIRIFQTQRMDINASWGSVVWLTLQAEVVKYDSLLRRTEAIRISQPHIRQTPIHSMMPNCYLGPCGVTLWTITDRRVVVPEWMYRHTTLIACTRYVTKLSVHVIVATTHVLDRQEYKITPKKTIYYFQKILFTMSARCLI